MKAPIPVSISQNDSDHFYLPPTIVRSKRVKRILLKMYRNGQFFIMVPYHHPKIDLPSILLQHQEWIKKHHRPPMTEEECFPKSLELRGIGEHWDIRYISTQSMRIEIIPNGNHQLTLVGNVSQANRCQARILEWLIEKATTVLTEKLTILSKQTGLSFRQVSIRCQSTCWGSCTRSKSIQLNAQLLFLEPTLLHHLLIHELCHTIHLNHSSAFWALMTQYDLDTKKHRQELKQAARTLPRWLEKTRFNASLCENILC